MKNWYVVYTQPNGENLADLHLQRQGFEVYLPRYSKMISHARYLKKVSRPLFQRYLFVRLNIETQLWRSINGTLGVTRLVSRGEKPVAVPEGIVDELKKREDEKTTLTINRSLSFEIENPDQQWSSLVMKK